MEAECRERGHLLSQRWGAGKIRALNGMGWPLPPWSGAQCPHLYTPREQAAHESAFTAGEAHLLHIVRGTVLSGACRMQRYSRTEMRESMSPACRAPTAGGPVFRLPVLQPAGPPSDGSWREGSGSMDALLRCLRPQVGRNEVCALLGHARGRASAHSPASSPGSGRAPPPLCPNASSIFSLWGLFTSLRLFPSLLNVKDTLDTCWRKPKVGRI